jgi:hypothetical protein
VSTVLLSEAVQPFLVQAAYVEQAVQQGRRVTLHMGEAPTSRVLTTLTPGDVALEARLAVPSEPRETGGLYWGYSTRIASSMDALFSACPFPVCILSFSPSRDAIVESFLVALNMGALFGTCPFLVRFFVVEFLSLVEGLSQPGLR